MQLSFGGALTTLRASLVGGFDAASRFGPEVQLHIEQDRRAGNLRRASFGLPALACMHLVVAYAITVYQVTTAVSERWRLGTAALHTMAAVFHLLMTALISRRVVKAAHVDHFVVFYTLVIFASLAVNAQLINGSTTIYVIAVLACPLWFRVRILPFACLLILATLIVVVGMEWTQVDPLVRMANRLTTLGFMIPALWLAVFTRNAQALEAGNHFLLDGMNDELKRRVDEQVREIVQRADEIERLNRQLDARVRERSRELSKALLRLASEQPQSVMPGTLLGKRVLVRGLLGVGGMGAVYRGYDEVLQQEVATKVVQATTASQLDSLTHFLREAETLASVRHPAIVRSFHVDVSDEGRLFQILELVQGCSLAVVLQQEKRLAQGVVARLGATLADALAATHAVNVIHRDVSLGNIMVTAQEPGVKLLDFGLSKFAESSDPSQSAQQIQGTPAFISPEQTEGSSSVGIATDVYSLGLVLYECLAGRSPYDAKSVPEWLMAHRFQPAAPLLSFAPDVDARIAAVLMQCLSKSAGDRPSARNLSETLAVFADSKGVMALIDLAQQIGESTGSITQDIEVPARGST